MLLNVFIFGRWGYKFWFLIMKHVMISRQVFVKLFIRFMTESSGTSGERKSNLILFNIFIQFCVIISHFCNTLSWEPKIYYRVILTFLIVCCTPNPSYLFNLIITTKQGRELKSPSFSERNFFYSRSSFASPVSLIYYQFQCEARTLLRLNFHSSTPDRHSGTSNNCYIFLVTQEKSSKQNTKKFYSAPRRQVASERKKERRWDQDMAEITAMPPYFDSLIFQGCPQWNHSLKWPKG
jgi:hypothetical protein